MADIALNWKGAVFRIPESRAFEAGAELEEVVTLAELQSWGTKPKFFQLARAMGVLLRFAGAKVSDRDVKAEIDRSIARAASDGIDADAAKEIYAVAAVNQLVSVLFDGASGDEDAAPVGKTSAS